MNRILLAAVMLVGGTVVRAQQQPPRVARVLVAFEPRIPSSDSASIVLALRDGSIKGSAQAKTGDSPLIATGKVTVSANRAHMVVALLNAKTGVIVSRDSLYARVPLMRDSARALGFRLARAAR